MRKLLTALALGGAVIAAPVLTAPVLAAPKNPKVDVCHWDNDNEEYVHIRISERAWLRGHEPRHEEDFLGTEEECDVANETEASVLGGLFAIILPGVTVADSGPGNDPDGPGGATGGYDGQPGNQANHHSN